jgi:hypothetical protein
MFVIYFPHFSRVYAYNYGIRVRVQTKNRAKIRLFFYMTK